MDSLNFAKTLGRSEMKKVMAGCDGNIYCNVGGEQYTCYAGNLTECTDDCVDVADAWDTYCAGCAQFPEL